MGGGGGFGKSESSSSQDAGSQFQQEVFGPQKTALRQLYGQLGGLFGQTMAGMQGQIPDAVGQQQQIFGAAMPAFQQQLQGGAFAGMPLQANYQQALQGGGNEQAINEMIMGGAGNNYAQAMKNQLAGDAMDRLGRTYAQTDLRAGATNLPGSSRHGLVQAAATRDELDRLADQQTNIGYQTFDRDLDRKLGIARRADQFDIARLGSAQNMLGAQQGAMMGGLNFGQGMQNLGMGQFAPHMAPWQAAGQYVSGIGRPTVLGSGSGTMSGSSDSKGLGISAGGKG